MHEDIRKTMQRYGMLDRGRRVGVAVSGGADSVFLLHVLAEAGLAVAVLHVNHKLRGAESERDEQFVRDLAARFALPFFGAELPPAQGNVEQEARRARYSFFEAQIRVGVCDSVATGHTREDQAETVLSRFLRGAGTAGLSGIRPVTGAGMIRPLLDLSRHDIRGWLRENGLTWQEDCSNLDTAYQRNRIRLDIMPQLATLNPALPNVMASFAAWAQGEEEYWDEQAARFETEHMVRNGDAVLVRTGELRRLPVAAERRMIRHMIGKVRGNLRSIDFRHVEAIRHLAASTEGSGRMQLPDLDIYRSFDWLRFAPVGIDSRRDRDFEVPLQVPGITVLPERCIEIRTECVAAAVYNNEVNALDWDKCAGSLVLRNWRPGDRYRPEGRTSAEKIKTFFQESRVPLWERRNWPVIVRVLNGAVANGIGGDILWSRQFGASVDFAPQPGSRRILLLRQAYAAADCGESNRTLGTSIDTDGCA